MMTYKGYNICWRTKPQLMYYIALGGKGKIPRILKSGFKTRHEAHVWIDERLRHGVEWAENYNDNDSPNSNLK
jgi:hypothetical protein